MDKRGCMYMHYCTIKAYGQETICKVVFEQYSQGGTCIRLVDTEDGVPYCTASVWVKEYSPYIGDRYTIIKNYAENVGILEALLEAGIVSMESRVMGDKGTVVPIGRMDCPVVQILVPIE
jgi:hypothetical protein